MLIASAITAFIAGLLIGAAAAWDKAFIKGKSWGYQLGCERRDDLDALDRIRRLM